MRRLPTSAGSLFPAFAPFRSTKLECAVLFARMTVSLLSTFAIILCLLGMTLPTASAVPFTQGNIVVYRVGDGSVVPALSSAAAAVFLDEYTPTGTLVQSIAMPRSTSGLNKRLTASGSSTTEGFLTQSADGRYIVLTGYDANIGFANVAGTQA